MKTLPVPLFCLVLLVQNGSAQPGFPASPAQIEAQRREQAAAQKFDLDFPGGSPKAVVAAIEKATGNPLSVIVPSEYENLQMPPMKVTGGTVAALFEALTSASQSTVVHTNGWVIGNYGFGTRNPGTNAIWYFFCNRQQEQQPETLCHFYQLADYLKDYKVEDITTAIQTGWQLLRVKSPPELKFHPETQLLIAVGPPKELSTIDAVLQELRKAPKQPVPLEPKRAR